MYELFLKRLSCNIFKNSSITDENKEVCVFGAEIILGTVINYLIVIGMGAFADRLVESIAFMCTYSCIRSQAGGYHANSKKNCLLIFTTMYCVILLFESYIMESIQKYLIQFIVVACVIIFCLSPVESVEVPIGIITRKKMKSRSMIIAIMSSVISVLLIFVGFKLIGEYIVAALEIICLILVMGKIKFMKGEKYEKE